MAKGDVTSLPKWAQDIIRYLEADVRRAKEERDEAWTLAGYNRDSPITLAPIGDRVRFKTGDGDYEFVDVHLDKEDRTLQLMSTYGSLYIRPQVTNVIHVGVNTRG